MRTFVFKVSCKKESRTGVKPLALGNKLPRVRREALLMFCYDFQVGTSTNTGKQPWRPSAANQRELNSRLRAQRKRRRLSSIIFLLLLIPFVAYEFNRMWQDPKLQSAHFALVLTMGVLIFLGILLLVGLLLRRPSKREDDKSILRL
jgi:hypothetical protein